MKKVLTIFFVTLGIIFFLLLLAGAYLYVVDPLNLKPLLFGANPPAGQSVGTQTPAADSDTSSEPAAEQSETGSALSPEQQAALETVGINPDSLPSEISPEQEACFTTILGAERVAQIQAGDVPTMSEFYQARSCLE